MNGSYFNIIHKHFNNKFSVLEFLYEYMYFSNDGKRFLLQLIYLDIFPLRIIAKATHI